MDYNVLMPMSRLPPGGTATMLTETDYQALRKKQEDNFQRDLEALERVRRIANIPEAEVNGQPRPVSRGPGRAGATSGKGKFIRSAREAIAEFSGDFSMLELHEALQKRLGKLNKQYVRTVLRRLEKRNEIATVRPGAGRRATIYRRK
jgi:hypothetical protein